MLTRPTIARRLILRVIIASSLITLLTTGYHLYSNYTRDRDLVKLRLDDIDIYINTISTHLWVADIEQLRKTLTDILSLPEIRYIELSEASNTIIKLGEYNTKNIIERKYPLVHKHGDNSIELGYLTIHATLDGVHQHLITQTFSILLSNAIKTFLIAALMLYLFHQLITRHLQKIATFANNLYVDNLHDSLILERKKTGDSPPDELDMVVLALSGMQQKLKHAITELHDSRNNLEIVNKELDSFCHSVSHDLKAPLRAIDGFSRIVLEDHADRLDEEGQDLLNRIVQNSQRMDELIKELLKLSRISRYQLKPEPLELDKIATSVIEQIQANEPDRRVLFNCKSPAPANGDAELIRIMLENLIGNAWKYTSKTDSPEIEFGVEDSGPEPVFYVRDNGAGFDMQYANRLFDPFHRLHRDNEFEGSGIGLATVQRIINLHDGKIWAESEVSQGATFYFTLP